MSKLPEKLDISYYETSWYTVCEEIEEKINEILDYLAEKEKEA